MLTGAELLNRVKELGDCAKTDLAKGCGYVVKKKDGSEQVKFTTGFWIVLTNHPRVISTHCLRANCLMLWAVSNHPHMLIFCFHRKSTEFSLFPPCEQHNICSNREVTITKTHAYRS